MYSASAPDRERAAAGDDLFGLNKPEQRRAKPTRVEHEIQSAIIDYLVRTGWAVLRLNSMAAKGEGSFVRSYTFRAPGLSALSHGMPDVMAWRGGAALALEVKRPGGKGTEAQLLCLNTLRRAGFVAAVVDSVEAVVGVVG